MKDENGRRVLNWSGGVIGIALIFLLGFALWALIFRSVPEANQNALTLLIGILSANVGMVVGFYFGSSATTKNLSETVNLQAKTAQTAGIALGTEPGSILLEPGEQATATATFAGTVIEPKP